MRASLSVAAATAMTGAGGLFAGLWWVGTPRPKRLAARLTWGLPLAVAVCSMAYPAYLFATRADDGDTALDMVAQAELQQRP